MQTDSSAATSCYSFRIPYCVCVCVCAPLRYTKHGCVYATSRGQPFRTLIPRRNRCCYVITSIRRPARGRRMIRGNIIRVVVVHGRREIPTTGLSARYRAVIIIILDYPVPGKQIHYVYTYTQASTTCMNIYV